MTTTATSTMRTITLTGRPPVRIDESQWPEIAHGATHNSRNGIERDWTRRADIRVRQHSDGRAIVYGTHRTKWQGESDRAAGELLTAGADLTAAIVRVAAALGYEGTDLAQSTIADLPAQDI